ncbi:YheC/YheD family protein [Paenibacillus hexagrammi]|uniref:YheC/YheD family protein n=1 Tax=Paenibacillus hexagrammi TaxID=2908839 RepID=A0ABY3SBL8_9BACL|nr:YheC/YheD family protein [Paenibacillus sp. YPD9-1]UJF31313.1 YheC/YheD family protein [Paenibacillus sp. YPD9-1]
MGKYGTSKWTKYKFMRKDASLRAHLPETLWLSEKAFWSLLDKYGEVIVKPTGSYGGEGVIRVRNKGVYYEVHDGAKKRKYATKAELTSAVLKKRRRRNQLVQRRISLATVQKRPFDLRVMVQRKKRGDWKVTGTLAKVAGKGFIVTNMRRSNGSILSFSEAIRRSGLKNNSQSAINAAVNRTALRSARQLQKYYSNQRTMGVDMGLDGKGKPWVIEVNFAPMLGLFLKLKDKSMYRTIVSYTKK